MRLKLCLVIPVTLDDASLADQRVLERGVHMQEAVVIAVDDKVGVVCRLLSGLDVLWALRDVFHCTLSAVEDAHQ